MAIVRLNNAAVYSINVHPARIAGANYNLADGTTVTHIGWGTLWVVIVHLFYFICIQSLNYELTCVMWYCQWDA